MADSEDFVAVAQVISRVTSLTEMQSRGLIRRLLKQAGLESEEVSAQQLTAVGRTLLREALLKNGVSKPDSVVAEWLVCCTKQGELASERGLVSNTVEEVFSRMGLRR